jgi:hypothetical protein
MRFLIARIAVHFAVNVLCLKASEVIVGDLSKMARLIVTGLVGIAAMPLIYRPWFEPKDQGEEQEADQS